MGKTKEETEYEIKKLAEEYQNKFGYSEQRALEVAKIYYDPIQRQEESIRVLRHSLYWCMNPEEQQHYEQKEIAEDLERNIKNEQLDQKKKVDFIVNNKSKFKIKVDLISLTIAFSSLFVNTGIALINRLDGTITKGNIIALIISAILVVNTLVLFLYHIISSD